MKKLLLDECIPRKFKNHLPGHDCLTVPEAGWAGKKNGELLSAAENAGFQVFVSLDQGIEFQQNLTGRNIAVILLRAKSNRLADLVRLASQILVSLSSIEPGNSCGFNSPYFPILGIVSYDLSFQKTLALSIRKNFQ